MLQIFQLKKMYSADCGKSFNVIRTVSTRCFFCCFGGHSLIGINLLMKQGIEEQNAGLTQLLGKHNPISY